jgi:hypothetical protein
MTEKGHTKITGPYCRQHDVKKDVFKVRDALVKMLIQTEDGTWK